MADFAGVVHTVRLTRTTNSVPPVASAPAAVRSREALTLLHAPRDVPFNEVRGSGTVSGTTMNEGDPDLPVHRRVRLYAERWGVIVAEAISDAKTGAFSFAGWNKMERFTVLAYDHTGEWGAVLANGVYPT